MPQRMKLEPAGRGAAQAGLWRDPAQLILTGWSTTQQVRYNIYNLKKKFCNWKDSKFEISFVKQLHAYAFWAN